MAEAIRISPEEVRGKITAGSALLVCAYEDDEKCKRVNLEGAIFLTEFRSRLPSLPKDQELIFYCA
jgi:hypothetical protein